MDKIYNVGSGPHIRTSETVTKVMLDVIIALTPAIIAASIIFGFRAFLIILISSITAVVSEFISQKLMKKEIEINDLSAVVTGILFAFLIPVTTPFIYVILGSSISILLGKMVFGGLGHNIFNPALLGRVILMISWPLSVITNSYDDKTGATLLDSMKRGIDERLISEGNEYLQAFLGNMGGAIGETSALALLIGALYLVYKKHIDIKVPIIIIGIVALVSLITGRDPLLQVLSGGLILGAFFMATDMTTTPPTSKGKIIFAIGVGILICLIRFRGSYPEGVAFAILLMNTTVPLINRYTRPIKFGGKYEK